MAKEDYAPLSATMEQQAKLPLYGASESQLADLKKSQEEALGALEQRYAQPNWFKVAAGFAKPQFGGFLASLGSASEALGENVEQQRQQQLPIAQMRAQLAQTNLLMGQNKTVSDMLAERRAKGLPITPEFVSEVTARFPESSVAKSLAAELGTQQKQQELTSSQQRLMLDAIQMKQAKGMALTPAETKFLDSLTSQLGQREEARPLTGTPSPFNQGDLAQQLTRAQADIDATTRELSRLSPSDPRYEIIKAEQTKAQAKVRELQGAGTQPVSGEQVSVTKAETAKNQDFYPKSFTPPSVEGMSDPERNAVMNAWTANAQAEEKRAAEQVNQWRSLAMDTVYSSLDSQYKSAIDLIQNNPSVAKKVFNLLRGDGSLVNQITSAFQAGLGVNLGNMVANVSVPVEAYKRAGLNQEEQMLADRLVNAMLTVGGAKLASQGYSPEKGQETYNKFLEGTKANLQQNAATALHTLQKGYVEFKQNKKLYDTVVKEHRNQVKSGTVTPYTDVLHNSPELARINAEAREQMSQHERDYEAAIRRANENRRKLTGGG